MEIKFLTTITNDELEAGFLELEEIGFVLGYIEFMFGEFVYGFIPEVPIPPNMQGLFNLSIWFEQLTEACLILNNSNYVIINDINSYNSWIEIKKEADKLYISDLKSTNKTNKGMLEVLPLESYREGKWRNEIVDITDFVGKVKNSAEKFTEELLRLNKYYNNLRWFQRIQENIKQINNY